MIYVGQWRDDIRYRNGESVTHEGMLWACSAHTRSRPGSTTEWTMLTKRCTPTLLGTVTADNGGIASEKVQKQLRKYIRYGAARRWRYLHGRAAHHLAQRSENLRKEVKALRDGLG